MTSRLALGVSFMALVLLASVHAVAQPRQIEGCNVNPADPHVVVADATIVAIQQPGYRCERSDALPGYGIDDTMRLIDAMEGVSTRPTASTGCVLVADSPACGRHDKLVMVGGSAHSETEYPMNIEVQVDGMVRHVALLGSVWRACNLSSGTHALTMCSDIGPVTCAVRSTAGTTTLVPVARVAPSARLHIDRIFHGPETVGAPVTVELVESADLGRVALPPRATFTWQSDDPKRRAILCRASPTPPAVEGCTRCDARGGGSPGWLIASAAIAFLVTRRRR